MIPPINIDNKIITNFREKANFFDNLFALKCTPIINDSILPSTVMYWIENRLSTINFKVEDLLGHDDISIRLLQIKSSEMVKPLPLIFKNYVQ